MSTIWETIPAFSSSREYHAFVAYIEAEVDAGRAEEVPATPMFGGKYLFGERWFRDPGSGAVWRLMPPDPPMRGFWQPVFPR